MAKKAKLLIHPALRVLMRTSPAAHFPSQPMMGSDYLNGVRLLHRSLTPTRYLYRPGLCPIFTPYSFNRRAGHGRAATVGGLMWKLEAATSFERAKKRYEKKRPDELAAVLRNLGRLRDRLDELPDCRAAQFGFLHPEPLGVWAIDQQGPSKVRLQETRLYVFPSGGNKTLHIITVGNKNSQASDLRLAAHFVASLTRPT